MDREAWRAMVRGVAKSRTQLSIFKYHLLKKPNKRLPKSIVLVINCYCLVNKSCPTPLDPMDCSPPGFSVHGILQARILE